MVLLKAAEFEKKDREKISFFNLNDIAEEARQIIVSARRESEQLLGQARAEIDRRFEEAQRQGHQAGYEKGRGEGREAGHQQALEEAKKNFSSESAQTIEALNNVLQEFAGVKDKLLWRAEQDTTALAIDIAEKVIKRKISEAPENADVTADNVKAALELIVRNTDVIVKINPGHLKHLEKMASKNKQDLGKFNSIRFEPDENITLGGCQVITEHGRIDGRLERQIERITEQLLTDTQERYSVGEAESEQDNEELGNQNEESMTKSE